MKTLIIGLGNPILTDDGVGVLAARAVATALDRSGQSSGLARTAGVEYDYQAQDGQVQVTEASVGGLRLMEMMVGYDRVILIDALTHGDDPPGTVRRLTLADLQGITPTQHSASAHDTGLTTALDAGCRMGLHLPQEITIYAIAVENVMDFGSHLTPAVGLALPRVVRMVMGEIGQMAA